MILNYLKYVYKYRSLILVFLLLPGFLSITLTQYDINYGPESTYLTL